MSDEMKKLIENLGCHESGELAILSVHLFSLCCHPDVPDWIKRMGQASVDAMLNVGAK